MEEGSKSIGIAVGVIIMLVLAAIAIGILFFGKTTVDKTTDTIGAQLDAATASTLSRYDNSVVTGTEVIAAIRSFQGQPLGMVVQTNGNSTGIVYGVKITGTTAPGSGEAFAKGTLPDDIYDPANINENTSTFTKSSSVDYISTGSRFQANIIKDQNGNIVGVLFKQAN